MPRPKKKEIKLDQESVLALLQEVCNECVEQRTTAIRIQNKMLSFMQGPDDLQQLGPVIKEQQKVLEQVEEVNKKGFIGNLKLSNKSDQKLLVLGSEILVGNKLKQDRVVDETVIVPENSTTTLRVSCCEKKHDQKRLLH